MEEQLKAGLEAILEEKNTKLIPENIKAGVTILGVTGTLDVNSGGGSDRAFKLFSSVEAMNESTNNDLGDLALIEVDVPVMMPVTHDIILDGVSTVYFPETVVLDAAITEDINVQFNGIGGPTMVITPTSAQYEFTDGDNQWLVNYSTTDGKTYVGGGTAKDDGFYLGTELCDVEGWNDVVGEFMQVRRYKNGYDGLYRYVEDGWIQIATTPSMEEYDTALDTANDILGYFPGETIELNNELVQSVTFDMGLPLKSVELVRNDADGANMVFNLQFDDVEETQRLRISTDEVGVGADLYGTTNNGIEIRWGQLSPDPDAGIINTFYYWSAPNTSPCMSCTLSTAEHDVQTVKAIVDGITITMDPNASNS